MTTMADRLLEAMKQSAARQYGGDAVTELAHALQCGDLAEVGGADEAKVIGKKTRPLNAWQPLLEKYFSAARAAR
ncbi:MAG: hypothetical protein Q7W02_11820 [Candidatus Rokubacteria bacterium]|nr:hypothetical protein [Candidatus Rokubacteria bacterium]